MKKFKSLVFAFSLFFSVLANSEEINLKKAASKKEPVNVAFKPGDTYKIYIAPLHQAVITFGNEIVEYFETGDNVSFNTIEDKHSVRIKVIDEGLNTDLVVKTNENLYYFKVTSTYSERNTIINFLYPQKEETRKRQIAKTTETIATLNLADLNNKYSISKKYNWTPVQIMDDGQKTYLFMPAKIQELPAFLVKADDGELAIVTYRVVENDSGLKLFVIDRLFKEAVLKLGEKTVYIKNNNFKY